MWGSKAISLNFLEILGSPAEHVLPTTLKGCLEKARFTAYVIEAREPNMIRIPFHSAQVAENKTNAVNASDKDASLLVHSTRDYIGKPSAARRKAVLEDTAG